MKFEEVLVDSRVVERRKPYAGIGTNDAPYVTQPTRGGKVTPCPYFSVWSRMLASCTDVYDNITVCSEWLTFMAFREWMQDQPTGDDKRLTRDVIVEGNKHFCPELCAFVTSDVAQARGSLTSLGPYLPGVTFPESKKYRAVCNHVHLGRFDTEQEAHEIWRYCKASHLRDMASRQTDARVVAALLGMANGL